ncbi:hypothetical protein IWQ61_001193 [Dispira simplex]|nr:hypothetical protein IWQ61_001193 [Dispira simplex]
MDIALSGVQGLSPRSHSRGRPLPTKTLMSEQSINELTKLYASPRRRLQVRAPPASTDSSKAQLAAYKLRHELSPKTSPYDTLSSSMKTALVDSPPLRPMATSLTSSPLLRAAGVPSQDSGSACSGIDHNDPFLLAKLEQQNASVLRDPKAALLAPHTFLTPPGIRRSGTAPSFLSLAELSRPVLFSPPLEPSLNPTDSQFWYEMDQQSARFAAEHGLNCTLPRTPITPSPIFENNESTRRFSFAPTDLRTLGETEFWLAVVQNYTAVQTKVPRLLASRVRAGIPPRLRGMVWQVLSHSTSTNLQPLYSQLLSDHSSHEKVIIRDLSRTFPHVPVFRQEGGEGQKRLFNVLKAYSLYDSEVGYCQGLGFILGPLLLNMPECEAFCVLVRLMETYDMRTMFTENMSGLHLRLYQFESLFKEALPELTQHFDRHNVSVTSYASSWFLSLFAYIFPLNLVFRIMDLVFAEGAPEIIIRIGLALLSRHQEALLACDEFEVIMTRLTDHLYCESKHNPTDIIRSADHYIALVSTARLEELADIYQRKLDQDSLVTPSRGLDSPPALTSSAKSVVKPVPCRTSRSFSVATPSSAEKKTWLSPWAKVVNAFSSSPKPDTLGSEGGQTRPRSRGSFSVNALNKSNTSSAEMMGLQRSSPHKLSGAGNQNGGPELTVEGVTRPKIRRERSWTVSVIQSHHTQLSALYKLDVSSHEDHLKTTDDNIINGKSGGGNNNNNRDTEPQHVYHDISADAYHNFTPLMHIPLLELGQTDTDSCSISSSNLTMIPSSTGTLRGDLDDDMVTVHERSASEETCVAMSTTTFTTNTATSTLTPVPGHRAFEQLQREHNYLVTELAVARVERTTLLEENDHLKEIIRELEHQLSQQRTQLDIQTQTVTQLSQELTQSKQALQSQDDLRCQLVQQLGGGDVGISPGMATSVTMDHRGGNCTMTTPNSLGAVVEDQSSTSVAMVRKSAHSAHPTGTSSNGGPGRKNSGGAGLGGFFQGWWGNSAAESSPSKPQTSSPLALHPPLN